MSAYRAGAAMAHLSSALAGIDGLGAPPKRGKKRRKSPPGASADLRRVASAFVAGRPASGSPGFDQNGQPFVRYVTDGIQFYVNGALIAERLVPSQLRPLSSEAKRASARAVKQIRVCPLGSAVSRPLAPGAIPTGGTGGRGFIPGVPPFLQTSAPYRPGGSASNPEATQREMMQAANEVMSLVKAGLSFRQVGEFLKGYREVISNVRLVAGGSMALLPGDSAASDCVIVELTERAREMALINYVTDVAVADLNTYRRQADLPVRAGGRVTRASKAELMALITQLRMAQQAGDITAAGRIAVQLQAALQTGRSQINFPGF